MQTKYMYAVASWLTILFPVLIVLGSAVADIGMSTIAILFVLRSFVEKDWKWIKELWVRCLFLLWFYMLLRGVFAENPYEALRRSLPFVRYFAFAAALAFWTLKDELTLKRFLKMFTGAVLFLAADGFLQWSTGRDVIMRESVHLPDASLRLTGPFHNPILGIMIAWLSFPVCIQFIMSKEGKLKFGFSSLVILFVLAVTALSGERMALLLTLLGWLAAVFLMPVRKLYLLAVFSAGLLVIGALAFVNHGLFERQIISTANTLQNWDNSPYGKLLTSDIKIAELNPLFGIGANHFRIECPKLYPEYDEHTLSSVCNIHPHNIYMEWFIEQGIIGFTIFITFITVIFLRCARNWNFVRSNPVFIGVFIGFILRLWPLASTTTFFSPFGAPPFWLLLGVLLFYNVAAEENKGKVHRV